MDKQIAAHTSLGAHLQTEAGYLFTSIALSVHVCEWVSLLSMPDLSVLYFVLLSTPCFLPSLDVALAGTSFKKEPEIVIFFLHILIYNSVRLLILFSS